MEKTILLVEDESIIREIVDMELEDENYKIINAEDGQVAIDILKKNGEKIDLVLLDLMLPNVSGYDVFDFLKQNKVTLNIPVIIVTAKNGFEEEDETSRKIYKLADDYIEKPFSMEVLLTTIRKHI